MFLQGDKHLVFQYPKNDAYDHSGYYKHAGLPAHAQKQGNHSHSVLSPAVVFTGNISKLSNYID